MPVIFLIPRRRKPAQPQTAKPAKKPAVPNRRKPAGLNLGKLGKNLINWRNRARTRINTNRTQRGNTVPFRLTPPPSASVRRSATTPPPANNPVEPTDPGVLLADFFSGPPPVAIQQVARQQRTTATINRPNNGDFDIPESLADLGVAPRRTSKVTRFQTASGRNFVARTADAAPAQPQADFELDEPVGPYVSMFNEGPDTVADQFRQKAAGQANVIGGSPFVNEEDEEADEEDGLEREEETVAIPAGELIAEKTYDPNKRGLRRRGGPRRNPIKFDNPRTALLYGLISAISLAAIVFFIIFISGSISHAPTGKYSVTYASFGSGPAFGIFNDSQEWDNNLGNNLLASNSIVDPDVRYASTVFRNSNDALQKAQSSGSDVLVWGYTDPGSGKLVANLALAPNGPYDPPVGQGRQMIEHYLYDPETMVFVTDAPTSAAGSQPLTELLAAINAYYSGNYDTALSDLTELLKANQAANEPGLRLLRGNVLFLFDRYAEAAADYNQVININQAALRNNLPTPVSPAIVYNNLAVTLSYQGNYNDANKDFTTALSYNNGLPKVFGNYAQFLLDHTDMPYRPDLLATWQANLLNAAKIDPKSAVIQYNLGRTYYYQGNYDLALNSESQAQNLDGNYLDAYYWLAKSILAKGQNDRQMGTLNNALGIAQDGANRASALVDQNRQQWNSLEANGNQTLAAVWDARARGTGTLLDNFNFLIARIYLEQTRLTGTDQGNPLDKFMRAIQSQKLPFEQASARLQEYLNEHPDDPDANFYVGQYLAITGTGDPTPYYQKAKDAQKDPNLRFQYNQILAQQYLEAGQPQQALAEYNEFIALAKNDPRGYLALSSLQYQLAMYKEASASADTAIKLDPNNANAYLEAGAAQVGNLQFQQAVSYLDRALVLNPQLGEAQLQRGIALFRLNRRKDALDAFSRALAINPNYTQAHFFAGIIYQETLNDNASAITEWQKTVTINPQYWEAWDKLGQTFSQINQIDMAINAYNQSLAANNNNATTHYYLGLLYEGRGQLAQAEAQYRAAIAVTPGLVNVYYHLALVLEQQGGKADDALAMAQNAVKLDPKSAEAQVALGDVYSSQSQFDPAVAAYGAALAIRKDYPEALYGRANAELGLGKNDPALADINAALQLRNNWAAAYILQGQILVAKKDLNGATKSFATARSLDPNDATLFANMGQLAQLQNQTGQAITYYQQSLNLYEPNTQVHFTLGQIYFNQRNFDGARQQFERVVQLNPTWKEINYWLGRTYAFLSQLPQAQTALEQMVQQEPNFVEAHFELGNVYRAENQRDNALAQYDQSIKLAQGGYPPAWLNEGQILEDMVNIPKAIEAYKNAQTSTDPQIRDAATAALQRLGAK